MAKMFPGAREHAASAASRRALPSILALAVIAFVAAAWWSQRVVVTRGVNSSGAADIMTEHLPVFHAGFSRLRAGELPLWNPDQLAGMPFMAVPWTGLLYPGNLVYLATSDVALAIEVTQFTHVVFGGFCMFFLVLALGMSRTAGLAAALTITMSGWIAAMVNFPVLVQGMMYLPATMLAVAYSLQGRKLGPLALALVVALQILNGSTEFLVYNLYAAGLYTLFELASQASAGAIAMAARRGSLLIGAIVLGVALAAVQLLPSLELAAQSSLEGGVPLWSALYHGTVPPSKFMVSAVSSSGMVGIGILPLLGVWLGAGIPEKRRLWLYACTLAIAAMLLTFGGAVFELYRQTPIGGLFRRPNKFLHLWAFAGALFSALALTRLQRCHDEETRASDLLRHPSWIGALATGVLGSLWLVTRPSFDFFLMSATISLALFAFWKSPRARTLLIVGLVVIHGLDLFTSSKNFVTRPYVSPDSSNREAPLFDRLGAALRVGGRDGRIHLSSKLRLDPGLMLKQGTLRGLPVTMDKQALTPARNQRFIDYVAKSKWPRGGNAALTADSEWQLLDLMSTRFYVLKKDEELASHMAKLADTAGPDEVRQIEAGPNYVVFERAPRHWVPRAHIAPMPRVVASAEEALAALSAPDFDPQREIVIESSDDASLPQTADEAASAGFQASARIVIDEPERVEIDAEASAPAYLLLTDTYYSGWRAWVNDIETPILRANYISRAVPIAAGRSRVVFEYAPTNLRLGLVISAMSGCLFVGLTLVALRRTRRRDEY
jgi:hypothetical protein